MNSRFRIYIIMIKFLRKRKIKKLIKGCEVLHGDPYVWSKEEDRPGPEKLGDIKIIDIDGKIGETTLKEKYRFQKMAEQFLHEKESK